MRPKNITPHGLYPENKRDLPWFIDVLSSERKAICYKMIKMLKPVHVNLSQMLIDKHLKSFTCPKHKN